MKKLILLIMLFAVACTVTKKRVENQKEEPKTKPIETVEFKGAWNNAEWDVVLVNTIKDTGLDKVRTSDMRDFNYDGGDLLTFWANLLIAVSKKESNWNKELKYGEDFNDKNGNPVISRGLFQISQESANNRNRGNCGFKTAKEIHDPAKNIWCSVRIFTYFVKADDAITGTRWKWKGPSRYWAVLRGYSPVAKRNKYLKEALAYIKAANK